MENLLSNPIVIGVLVGAPSFLLGYLGYRRSRKADVTTAAAGAISQIIDGLNKLLDSLQDDNLALRTQLTALQTRFESTVAERDQLKERLAKITGMACIVVFLALLVFGSAKRDDATEQRIVDRAALVAKQAGENAVDDAVADASEPGGSIDDAVTEEVEAQVDEQLPATTTSSTVTTTTTTTTTEAPPIVTVPIPTTLPEPPPTTLPTLPELPVP